MPILIALKLFAGNALSAVWKWLGGLTFWQLLCLGLAAFALVQHFQLAGERRHSAKVETQLAKEHAGRVADRISYGKAQERATADNKAKVERVEQTYQRNSDNERQAYLRDLNQLRADRLRQRNAAPQSAPGTTGTPAPDTGAARIDANGLCVPATSDVCEAGAEIELRLMHLQNLFEQQTNVDPNK